MALFPPVRSKKDEPEPLLTGSAGRGRSLRVLFVYSQVAGVNLCVHELTRGHFNVSADVVLTSEQFATQLKSEIYDVVVAEYPTPLWEGPSALELLRQLERHIPLIFVNGIIPLETVAELITEGAADCVEMDHVGHLPVAVRRALSENNLRRERDQTEKMLRHSEARYRALAANLTYGICRCSADGKYLDVNQALATMLGYSSREELLGVDCTSKILCDPSQRARLLGQTTESDDLSLLEIDWKRKDGTPLSVRLRGREVRAAGSETESYEIIVEDVTQQRKLEDQLRHQAAKDPLTGLANYRQLVDVLAAEIKRSERTSREFALLLFDLDGLKQINAQFGQVTGSQAIGRFADLMGIGCRDIDTAARHGGDEFALVLPETGSESANLVAQRICESFAADGGKPQLSASVGVAIYPRDGTRLDNLLSAADVALSAMKNRKHSLLASAPINGDEYRGHAAAAGNPGSGTST